MNVDNQLVEGLKTLCLEAGEAILSVYARSDIPVTTKTDDTPVTEADYKAHCIITEGLERLGPLPVISEEGTIPDLEARSDWEHFWLVDPVDGTREFIARTDEFTINIALIHGNEPVFGMIYVPVSRAFYYGGQSLGGAWRQQDTQAPVAIHTRACAPEGLLNIATSRHHGREQMAGLVEYLESRFEEVHLTIAGSSLKGCLVAEGMVDIYPRRGPTSEWDTAATQAIVEAAGGIVVGRDMKPLRYNTRESLINPDFYVIGDPSAPWETLLD